MADTGGSSFDTTVYVLDDCDARRAVVLACDDDGGPDQTSLLPFHVEAGATVYLVVDGFGDASGAFTLEVRRP